MRKLFLSALLGTGLWVGLCADSSYAEVVVHKKPPHAVTEHASATPGPGYVWIAGFQEWDGSKFVWQPGRWVIPPHEHAIWMVPRWERTPAGYVFVEGWWV